VVDGWLPPYGVVDLRRPRKKLRVARS